MALNVKDHNITVIFYKLKDGTMKTINNVYKGSKLIWTSIKEAFSAFGAGFWQNDKPWSNEDSWKNEPR